MTRTYLGVGTPGLTGPTGPPGPTGPTGVGANWRGVWSSGTTYALADGVYRNGIPYVSNVGSNLNHDPATDTGTNWGRAAGVTPFQYVDDLSAAPRSVTDWGAIINTAISSGVRHFVFGDFEYTFSTPIVSHNTYGLVFEGSRSMGWGTTGSFTFSWARGSRLVYTGGASPHITAADGAITSGQTTLTSASGPFTASPSLLIAGAPITITGAGPAGATLTTKIVSVTSTTQVVIADVASTTVTGATINFINWTSAMDFKGCDGTLFRNLGLFYNNSAFDGILFDARYLNTWSSVFKFENAQMGSATVSDNSWADYTLDNAYTLIHANGVGERFTMTDCTLAGAKALVRGMYQMNSDDFTFQRCNFFGATTDGQIVNPGRWWKFRDCVFSGVQDSHLTNPAPAFTCDTAYGGGLNAYITITDCSFWDWNNSGQGSLIRQDATHTWYLKITGLTLFWTNVTGLDISLLGPGSFWIDGANMTKSSGAGIDVGDAAAGGQKTFIYISGLWTESWDNGLIAHLDTGHLDVCVEDAPLPQRKFVSGHQTLFASGRIASLIPSTALSAGQTAIASKGIYGDDSAGVIFLTTTGSGLIAGGVLDVTFAHAWPSHFNEADPNGLGVPCVTLTSCSIAGNNVGSDVASSTACGVYVKTTDNDTGWTLAITAPVSGAKNLAWFYRVIKL